MSETSSRTLNFCKSPYSNPVKQSQTLINPNQLSPNQLNPSQLNPNQLNSNQVGSSPTPNGEQNPAVADLLTFLANAPRLWQSPQDPPVRKFKMSNGEDISCIRWKGRFFITGTDIVKVLMFRFQQIGRGILNPKKFEEGVFSDLRNLKPGTDAVLEEPRSEFLEFLHKHGCIRTQKKQKVFFWHCVPHDDLFREALERNLKRAANVFNWTQMMNSPEMMKQYMMLQAASNGQILLSPNQPFLMNPTIIGAPYSPYLNAPVGIGSPLMATTTSPRAEKPEMNSRRTVSLSAIDFTNQPETNNRNNFGKNATDPIQPIPLDPSLNMDLPDNDLMKDLWPMDKANAAIDSPFWDEPTPTIPSNVSESVQPVTLDQSLNMSVPNGEILTDLLSQDKATPSPLWDDISMMMPGMEPNNQRGDSSMLLGDY